MAYADLGEAQAAVNAAIARIQELEGAVVPSRGPFSKAASGLAIKHADYMESALQATQQMIPAETITPTNADDMKIGLERLRQTGLLKPIYDEGMRQLRRRDPKKFLQEVEKDANARLGKAVGMAISYAEQLRDIGMSDSQINGIVPLFEKAFQAQQEAISTMIFPSDELKKVEKMYDDAKINITA